MRRMNKISASPMKSAGGYNRKPKRYPKGVSLHERDISPVEVTKVHRPKPLPNGIRQALNAMASLAKSLREHTNIMTVSIEPDFDNNTWYLIVRGFDPGVDYYLGYEVKYKQSNLIRNPDSKSVN